MYSRFMSTKLGIVFVTSHPMTITVFLEPHILALKSLRPLEVLANSNESFPPQSSDIGVPIYSVPIVRQIAPWADIQALCVLYLRFKKNRPIVVHTITPKAGFLGMAAAFFARVPVRVHSFTGQVWVTRRGFMRWLLKAADKCIAEMATDVLVDSPSQRQFLIDEGVVTASRSRVLGAGSIRGVNTERFFPDQRLREVVRNEMETDSDAVVCLYLGRLNRDKGVLEIASAFSQIASRHPKSELWIVGPDEADWFRHMQVLLGSVIGQVKRVGFTFLPERFMKAADLFCMPSYREGFGSSVIEAAACGVPSLVSRIYGLTDAVVEGKTGWMHKAGDIQDLAQKLDRLLSNSNELFLTGQTARRYVETHFAEGIVTAAMKNFYEHKLSGIQET